VKPAPFEYFAPLEAEEALELLQRYGDEAKVLAGGQSLMPFLSLRLARPAFIIDINRLPALDHISPGPDGGLALGALTRQRSVERSRLIQERNPLLSETIPLIGHFQIRNRGTVGGSLAHADPAAELPAVSLVVEAEFLLRCTRGERAIEAQDFFLGTMTTAIEPGELLTEIRIPGFGPRTGWAIEEVARRRGDFAIVGVAVVVELNDKEICQEARIALFGVGDRPARMERAETMLRDRTPDEKSLAEVAAAVSDELDPFEDVHASAEYRKEVGGVLTRRALEKAFGRARERIRA